MKNPNISLKAVCPLASCSCSNTCARYTRFLQEKAESDTFELMNTNRLQVTGETCPYHLTAEKQRWARGFKNIYSTIPHGNTYKFNLRTSYTQRRFYKAKNGEIPIPPEMQQELLTLFEQSGANMGVGFDAYEEHEVLLEK